MKTFLSLLVASSVLTSAQAQPASAPLTLDKTIPMPKLEGRTRFIGVTGHYEPNALLEVIRRAELDCLLMAVNAADRHCVSPSSLMRLAENDDPKAIKARIQNNRRLILCAG